MVCGNYRCKTQLIVVACSCNQQQQQATRNAARPSLIICPSSREFFPRRLCRLEEDDEDEEEQGEAFVHFMPESEFESGSGDDDAVIERVWVPVQEGRTDSLQGCCRRCRTTANGSVPRSSFGGGRCGWPRATTTRKWCTFRSVMERT